VTSPRIAPLRADRDRAGTITRLARADASTRPLPSPCLERWRTTGAKVGTPLWAAAAWEARALEASTLEARTTAYTRARTIVADARTETEKAA